MTRPLAIDGFCRKGGAGHGYQLAGFDVIGVDKEDHADGYPGQFIQGDALTVIPELCERYKVAVVHGSPPCQANIAITAGNRARDGWADEHVNLIPETRAMHASLRARYGMPTVIENGPSKHLRDDVVLCGLTFDLPTFRHRYFELDGLEVDQPAHVPHRGHLTIGWRHGHKRTVEPSECPYEDPENGGERCGKWHKGTVYGVYGDGGGKPSVLEAQRALGIDWMTDIVDLNEAIPPAYTRFIGRQLMAHLEHSTSLAS